MSAWSPKRLIAFVDEGGAGLHHLGGPAHVKGEVLATRHVRRRLDHEQTVVVNAAGWPQKRAHAGKAVGAHKAQPRIKRLGFGRIGHKVDDVRQRARSGRLALVKRQHIGRPLGRGARRVDGFSGQVDGAAHADLKTQHEARIVGDFDRAVGQALHRTVFAQLFGDGTERGCVGHAVNSFAQHAGSAHGRWQGRVAAVRNDNGGAVKSFEAAAACAARHWRQAVVG